MIIAAATIITCSAYNYENNFKLEKLPITLSVIEGRGPTSFANTDGYVFEVEYKTGELSLGNRKKGEGDITLATAQIGDTSAGRNIVSLKRYSQKDKFFGYTFCE